MKDTAIEFHDSEVSTIELEPRTVVVKFSAACVHRSKARPGLDSGAGYIQALELLCSGAKVLVHESGCTGRILEGSLVVDGGKMSVAPVPFESTSKSRLDLVFANGSRFSVEGSSMIVRVPADARFVERFSC